MKSQIVCLLAALLVLASVLLVRADQDEGCRRLARDTEGMAEARIASVRRFTLYGQPRHPKTCKEACAAAGKTIGFDYYGKQACCCGEPQSAA